jgi:hypothetical protein
VTSVWFRAGPHLPRNSLGVDRRDNGVKVLHRWNGPASTTCSAFQLNNPRIRTESLRTKVSVAGKWNFQGRDKEAETASKVQGRRYKDKVSLNNPANSGLISENQEISNSGKMRGGAERIELRARHAVLSKGSLNRGFRREIPEKRIHPPIYVPPAHFRLDFPHSKSVHARREIDFPDLQKFAHAFIRRSPPFQRTASVAGRLSAALPRPPL